ncbi:unnamed protein product [Gongylonema pulchrum]|uniref:Omp85 domain-containing protein n=1 Tax=Gongylonema pulchrum TaxID=637853 RepID=A0A183DI64_9BILA|nr:unnamed protein product [Gongylonema pulchrum]
MKSLNDVVCGSRHDAIPYMLGYGLGATKISAQFYGRHSLLQHHDQQALLALDYHRTMRYGPAQIATPFFDPGKTLKFRTTPFTNG